MPYQGTPAGSFTYFILLLFSLVLSAFRAVCPEVSFSREVVMIACVSLILILHPCPLTLTLSFPAQHPSLLTCVQSTNIFGNRMQLRVTRFTFLLKWAPQRTDAKYACQRGCWNTRCRVRLRSVWLLPSHPAESTIQ